MFSAFVQQGIVLILAGMILDGGFILQICFAAFVAFWGGVALMLFRRAASPTKLCPISFFVMAGIWKLRGF